MLVGHERFVSDPRARDAFRRTRALRTALFGRVQDSFWNESPSIWIDLSPSPIKDTLQSIRTAGQDGRGRTHPPQYSNPRGVRIPSGPVSNTGGPFVDSFHWPHSPLDDHPATAEPSISQYT